MIPLLLLSLFGVCVPKACCFKTWLVLKSETVRYVVPLRYWKERRKQWASEFEIVMSESVEVACL